jgi:signal transduction histidine kinase
MGLGEKSWTQYYELFKNSFSDTKFDTVIGLDDNAFNFLIKYGDKLFPNTPVIFSGVYNFNKSIISKYPLFTGLAKSDDVKSTLDIALKLHPNTKQIFVIDDYIELKKNLIPLYQDKVKIILYGEKNILKIKQTINNLPKDTIIYFGGAVKDDRGQAIPLQNSVEFLFKDINIPVYSVYYIQLNKESVGGMVTKGTDLGEEVAQLALRILDGEKPSDIPVIEDSAHNYVFNYDKLKQFNIDLNVLPKGAEVVNRPTNFYNISKTQALYLIVSIVFLITLSIFFIIINIYRRRLAEKSLSDSENLLSTLINSTPNIVYFKSPEGKFLEVNNAALDILNINEKDYKNINELFDIPIEAKSVLTKWASKDEEAWETGTVCRSEEMILDRKENLNKIYDTLRIPLFNDDGTRQGLILLGVDITENKTNEKNEQRIKELIYYDKLKTNFFSNISHELRTPLNLVFSALQIIELKTSSFKEEQKIVEKYIGIMRQNCYRLLRIIGNLIDITKIDAGHFYTQHFNRDIVNVVENIVLSVVHYVENKGISIIFDTEIEEKIIAFDPDAMERILLNLLSNSIKFTPNGGSIQVNIYDKVNSIAISVKDTGIGIPPDKQSSIFEKFVQVDKSLSRNREGSGIGLSLVKELVLLHNGTIELESTLGKGTEFRIELPVSLVNEDESSTNFNICTCGDKAERVKIEFSDIYN